VKLPNIGTLIRRNLFSLYRVELTKQGVRSSERML